MAERRAKRRTTGKSEQEILTGINKRNPTIEGPTGKVPKPKNPGKVHDIEQARRITQGGSGGYSQYLMKGSRNSTYDNPRTIRNSYEPMTFKEFMMIAEQRNAGPSTPVKFDDTMKQLVPNQGATRVGNVRLKKNSLGCCK
ncbi:MAG: hypothetical protein FJX95_10580 [Bacteroidetes bacterium]|nr:hypothetical protein [Bacteroidota bacterium]